MGHGVAGLVAGPAGCGRWSRAWYAGAVDRWPARSARCLKGSKASVNSCELGLEARYLGPEGGLRSSSLRLREHDEGICRAAVAKAAPRVGGVDDGEDGAGVEPGTHLAGGITAASATASAAATTAPRRGGLQG